MNTIKVVNKSDNQLPKYETNGAAGMDLRASFKYVSPENPIKLFGDGEIVFKGESHSKTMLRLEPGSRAIIPTDLYITVPKGTFCAIFPRSGLSIKKGLSLVNAVGVLDEDYTGNMGIPVINHGLETLWIEDGERIAQMIILPYVKAEWQEVESLEDTERNSEGFGSTNLDENGNYIAGK
jgi:dUTP pyrophosphatase